MRLFADDSLRLTQWAPEQWAVAPDWRPVVDAYLAGELASRLGQFVRKRLNDGAVIYPPHPFHALNQTPLAQVRVVILGQDPYHGLGQAQGLAFSVAPGVKIPHSLRNIFKEISQDCALGQALQKNPADGSLQRWTQQGVLLLNTCMTVEEGRPGSHARQGWESLTDDIIKAVAVRGSPVVFMLWGAHAQSKQNLIESAVAQAGMQADLHLVLTANHPSPLSALRPPKPFLGCGHFSLANDFLRRNGSAEINW
jgi:uracil-DNA glycosylase